MLMILALWGFCAQTTPRCLGGFVPKLRPADAHDAGSFRVLCPKYAQLMLMMLALWGLVSKLRRADAHDAGSLGFGVQSTSS